MAKRKALTVAIEDQLTAFLLENPGATRDQIARGIGVGKYDFSARCYTALRRMEKAGQVTSAYAERQYLAGPLHYTLTDEYVKQLRFEMGSMPPLVTITQAKRNAKPPQRKKKHKGK